MKRSKYCNDPSHDDRWCPTCDAQEYCIEVIERLEAGLLAKDAALAEVGALLLSHEAVIERLEAERTELRAVLRHLVDVVHPHTLSMRSLLVLADARALVAPEEE